MSKPITWSYSSLSLFQQCPQKYYRLRVAKDIKDPPSKQMLYGTEAHKAAEDYVRDGTPLHPHFKFMQPVLDTLRDIDGDKHCEQKLGLTEDLQPCGFFDPDVWWRGIADLVILQDDVARVLDYKTGKAEYADTKQLEIISLAIFKHFPNVESTKSGLLFVVHNKFIPAAYKKEDEAKLWAKWKQETDRLNASYENNVWNATKNFTCRSWCPVFDCPHNGRKS